MAAAQGSLDLLKEPVAQELLASAIPARLSYVWKDGTPRVVPIWFGWSNDELVVFTPPGGPKTSVVSDGTAVAVTIDTDVWPARSLTIRGRVTVTPAPTTDAEYTATAGKYLGAAAAELVPQIQAMFPEMRRIAVTPEWVGLLDFVTGAYIPRSWQQAMAAMSA